MFAKSLILIISTSESVRQLVIVGLKLCVVSNMLNITGGNVMVCAIYGNHGNLVTRRLTC